ncbi:MAG: long-chain fatty acid--CoA ligase [Saprospiraceae bacterium]|nr:long-chain fatty acid--CoA ligase [Saprospiraceae bacterium]
MEIKRLFDIPYYQKEKYGGLAHSIGGKHMSNRVDKFSTDEFIELANKVSLGLWQIGLKPGDKIALISYNNRPEWNIMDIGMQQIGVVNVPVYPTISPSDYVYIFNDASIKYCFVGHGDLLDKVRKAQKDVPSLTKIFTFDEADAKGQVDANGEAVEHWETIFSTGDLSPIEEQKAKIKPEDLATLIYTSGTTGKPKGVMLTHSNVTSNVNDVLPLIPLGSATMALSFLPLCHVFERTVTYSYMAKGVSIMYAQSIDTLGENLKEFKPHFFTTVPRLLEKVYEKIASNANSKWLSRTLFNMANSAAEGYTYDNTPSGLKWMVAQLVFKKIRAALGGNVVGIVTGAAACPAKMARFFSAAGIAIREGYGLTETAPAISINQFEPNMAMLGTVGPILPSVDVKIELNETAYGPGAGEILVKGPNVMQGYYNKPDKTAEVFNEDGWFLTGDVGKIITKNVNGKKVEFLKITDRKKELMKTSGGKYVAPTPIENRFKEEFLIEQLMVVGEGKKFVSALIVPSFDMLKSWCADNGVNFGSEKEVVDNPKVIAHYQTLIDGINPELSKIDKIKKFKLVPDVWSVETGELTPTMKLKRRVVLANYKAEIDNLYNV